jgi:pseudaminic acid cytidylyltransferase
MSALAIIPARGGSKRIPRKNIKLFCGKPIIAYSIENALKSKCFEEVMVSTDDKEIAEIALGYGAKIPFYRSEKTSNDFAGLLDVIQEVTTEYELLGRRFDELCCILATAPLIKQCDLTNAHEIFKKNKFDSVFPVVCFSYPIQRALRITDNRVSMIWPENYEMRSQDLQLSYHDVGQFYWLNHYKCFEKKRIFTDNSGVIVLPETQVQDIDTQEDWEICELKYQKLF